MRRAALVLGIIVTVAALGFAGRAALTAAGPAAEDLETVQAEGEALSENSAQVTTNIATIAGNIELGTGLGDSSARIKKLTRLQYLSLRRVERLLSRQLGSVEATTLSIARIRRVVADLDVSSARQADLLAETLISLRRLREIAAESRRTSSYFLSRARYGAKLAEDSARSFEGP
jgi:hypothetical protein